jgi:predicted Fe-Mo cluster-binding NifX family protein
MKIAIPTIGGILDEYFESCEVFTIFSVDDSYNILDSEIFYTPEGCDCKNNKPLIMQEKGVTFMVAYKMPSHADGVCEKHGIEVHLGYTGNVREVAEAFLQKKSQFNNR